MAIIYGVVARGTAVVAEYAAQTGNFQAVTQQILEKIPNQDSRMSYVYDRYLFHYIQKNNMTFLCMANDEFPRRIAFAFLEDLMRRFDGESVNEFSNTIRSQMEFYSNDPDADKIRQVQGEIDQVRGVMTTNIEKVLERGERIDLLVDKTDNLNQSSFAFRNRSTALRRRMWWKNQKLMVGMVVCLIFGIHLFVSVFCGFPNWSSC